MESLVGLRAELQRKKEQQKTTEAASRLKPKTKLKIKSGGVFTPSAPVSYNSGVTDRDARDRQQKQDAEPSQDKVRAALARKAALYEQLQGGVAALHSDTVNNSFLVNFQKKIVDTVLESKRESEKEAKLDPKEWVEYTDSLGRTREVRRTKLKELQEQDRYIQGHDTTPLEAVMSGSAEPRAEEVTELQQEFEEQQLNKQRLRWEQQEETNATKEHLHYQDVMFDEARTHGAGFVRLSGDATERARQQQMLRELHDSSAAAARQHRQQQRSKEKTMAARLEKIRQRKRLKLGLPMIDSDSNLKTPPPSSDEEEDEPPAQASSSSDYRAAAASSSSSTAVREWDVGKQLVGKFVEPADKDPAAFARKNLLGGPLELSQELWVDRKRRERKDDFAPPSIYGAPPTRHDAPPTRYDSTRRVNSSNKHSRSTCDEQEDNEQRELNRRKKHSKMSHNIVNECTDHDTSNPSSSTSCSDTTKGKSYETSSVFIDYKNPEKSRKRAEIPPPASWEYYEGEARSGRASKTPVFQSSKGAMEDAITEGLKRFRENPS